MGTFCVGDNAVRKTEPLKSSPNNTIFANKAILRSILEQQDRATGFVMDISATPLKARALLIDQGVLQKDNEFSCAIRRMREGD